MKVPLIKPDLPRFDEVAADLRAVLESGAITNFGPHLTAFEREASDYLGCPVAAVSSCTAGLLFALHALGVKPRSRVAIPSFTFIATAQAVLYSGAIPVFVDVGEDLMMDPEDLRTVLERYSDICAVIPVHTYGLPCRIAEIEAVVASCNRSVRVLYDAAHAFGAAVGQRRIGTFGDAEVFSLSATKVLVSVEGGFVSSKDPELLHRVRKMRNYGIEENYDAHHPGLNGKMSELHAVIGRHNLRRVEGFMAERQKKARFYRERIRSKTSLGLLPVPESVTQTFKDFTVVLGQGLAPKRDRVISLLKERGVDTRAYFFPPVHEQRYFQRFADRKLPRTEELCRRVLTLPFFTTITEEEMSWVVDALASVERSLA